MSGTRDLTLEQIAEILCARHWLEMSDNADQALALARDDLRPDIGPRRRRGDGPNIRRRQWLRVAEAVLDLLAEARAEEKLRIRGGGL